jgi:hypothetical protein
VVNLKNPRDQQAENLVPTSQKLKQLLHTVAEQLHESKRKEAKTKQ